MESPESAEVSPKQHIKNIFGRYELSDAFVLESLTNLSNTVIDTALSGQNKFVFEILQNADDSFSDQFKNITVQFILQDEYCIIQHNGKEFDFNDVERICSYASQIKEVKARDLNKTGYKGIGFKSLFNLTDCIYICSGGYSFRFDKTYWSNPESKTWQVIPIWCTNLPMSKKYKFNEPVNFILKFKKAKQLERHLKEVIDHPEYFLYLRQVNGFRVNLFGRNHVLERKLEVFNAFVKSSFFINESIASSWLSRVFKSAVPVNVQNIIRKGSKYTYPDKVKEATEIPITFTVRIDEACKEIVTVRNGLCFNTLPTQSQLTLPYHINGFFILNLDRTQLDENDFNQFIFEEIGYLQLNMLKDLAALPHLRNFVVELFAQKINHPYSSFNRAFSKGLSHAKNKIAWLPAQEGSRLLKLDEAWVDEIQFFKQNFKNIRDDISPNVIDYDVTKQYLLPPEVKRFTYDKLFNEFPNTYHPQLTDDSYLKFISYLYKRLKKTDQVYSNVIYKLRAFPFLRTKNGTLSSPESALLEEFNNPVHSFFELNPIDNKFLPLADGDSLRDWLISLGVKRLKTPVHILRESLLKWIDNGILHSKITEKNHIPIINYLAENSELLTKDERKILKENLLVLTKSKEFKLMKTCYLPEAFPVTELEDVISNDKKISPVYNMDVLRNFLTRLGICKNITPYNVFRKSLLEWIKNNEIESKLNIKNYIPIIDYFASRYSEIEDKLTADERSYMKKMPVLTRAQTFQRAEVCYFDSILQDVLIDFQCAIPMDNLVCSKSISKKFREFLIKVGVSEKIKPIDVIRKSVLKWIAEGKIKSKINSKNHKNILSYIADKWENLIFSGLEQHERKYFSGFPILTEGKTFKEAGNCYWKTDGSEIPNIGFVIPSNDFVSSEYDSTKVERLLENEYFGVRSLTFRDICEKYCDHLTRSENIKWFFSHLIYFWEHKWEHKTMLNRLRDKLLKSCLLAKNGCKYFPKELYSFRFLKIHSIDRSLPLLHYKTIPEDLGNFLGFKGELEMSCIEKLLEAFDKEQKKRPIGEENTSVFFSTLLEQLKSKNINEIKKHALKLLSKSNELKPAKSLYYFEGEDDECQYDDCYLKRIMPHNDTLELAKLCSVNILPFRRDVSLKREKCVTSLKDFYLERLPYIALKEAKERNDSGSETFKKLYSSISLIELFECDEICLKYPFGTVKQRLYFDNLRIYVVQGWRNKRTDIYEHLRKKLCLKANIAQIIDTEILSDIKEEWLQSKEFDPNTLHQLEKELQNLRSGLAVVEQPSNSEAEDVDSLQEDIDVDFRHEIDRPVYQQPSASKWKQDVEDSFLYESDVDSVREEATYRNTLTRFSTQDSRAFDNLSYNSKSKENVANPRFDNEPGQSSYTLKEYYLKRLPSIVIGESKKQNQSPHFILQRLYSKVLSIEVISHTWYSKKSTRNLSAYANCYFDGLKIYVPENWTDCKTEIHEHIIEELCLSSSVEDIAGMESMEGLCTESFEDENSELFNLMEEELRKLLTEQIGLNCNEINESLDMGNERCGSNSTTDDEFSDQSSWKQSAENIYCRQYTINPNIINNGLATRFSDKQESLERQRTSKNINIYDITDFGNGACSKKSPIQHPKSLEQNVCGSLIQNPSVKSSLVLPRHKSPHQKLNESYVFSFLQDHYKNKYTNARCGLFSSDRFVLQWSDASEWKSRKIEIIWINESGNKELPYDLIVKKDCKIKQIIDVQSHNKALADLNDSIIYGKNRLIAEQKENKDRYCIYCVFKAEDSADEKINDCSALYKIVPLKY